MRAHFCKDFMLIAFSVLDLWPFYENDPKSAQKHDFLIFLINMTLVFIDNQNIIRGELWARFV